MSALEAPDTEGEDIQVVVQDDLTRTVHDEVLGLEILARIDTDNRVFRVVEQQQGPYQLLIRCSDGKWWVGANLNNPYDGGTGHRQVAVNRGYSSVKHGEYVERPEKYR